MVDTAGKVFVIGISGTTNSGKSTVCKQLVQKFSGSVYMCQDHYFFELGDPRLEPIAIPELGHWNFEDYRALKMDQLVEDLKKNISGAEQTKGDNNVFIFVEGFSLFGWRPLVSLIQKKYFITVDRETCLNRRKTRHYEPPDVPNYFEQVVWPMHLSHLKLIEDQTDIVYLDGGQSIDHLCSRLLSEMDQIDTASSCHNPTTGRTDSS